jgi:chemotaxis protein MotB
VQQLRSTVASLESSKETLSQKSEALSRQLLDSRNQIEGLQKEIATKAEEHQQLLSRVALLDREKGELARLKDALKNQLGMTQGQIEELSMETEAKEKLLKSKEKQLKSMQTALQELSKQFEQQIKEKEIQINNLEDKLNIRLLDKILFASGSADITAAGNRVLESLAAELKKMEGFEIAVAGHTDNKLLGPKLKKVYYDNLGLSVARAAAVSRKLREMGVSPENLSAVGYSMHRPVSANDTKEGRQQNRRVEIMLEPLH